MDISGSSDAKEVVLSNLESGLDGDYDIHGNDKTTRAINWCWDFKKDVRKLSSRKDTWSQTENEMLLSRMAIHETEEIMKETPMGWVHPISNLKAVTKPDTACRAFAGVKLDNAMGTLSTIRTEAVNEEDYIIAVLKEDARTLNKYESDYGMDTRERMIMGFSRLIVNNKSSFSRGTIYRAESVIENIERQLESKHDDAVYSMSKMGECIRDGLEEGDVWPDMLEEEVDYMRENYDGALEAFEKGFGDIGVISEY